MATALASCTRAVVSAVIITFATLPGALRLGTVDRPLDVRNGVKMPGDPRCGIDDGHSGDIGRGMVN